jgi:hypothetical protein
VIIISSALIWVIGPMLALAIAEFAIRVREPDRLIGMSVPLVRRISKGNAISYSAI